MTMPIGAIAPVGAVGSAAPTTATTATSGSSGGDFAAQLTKGLDAMSQSQQNVDNLSIQAATGQQVDPAAVTIATTQAQLMTQLASTVQSKAVAAFNTIMGMQA